MIRPQSELEQLECHIIAGRLDSARQVHARLCRDAEEPGISQEARAILRFHEARILLSEARYAEALEAAGQAFDYFRTHGNRSWIARSHLLISGILLRKGDYRRSGEHAEAAVYFYTWEVDNPRYRAEAYEKLGIVHKNLGSWGIAEENFRKALKTCAAVSEPTAHLRVSLNLAILLRKMGKINEAASMCREGFHLAEQIEHSLGICRYALELANIDVVRGDIQAGLEHVGVAARIADERGYKRGEILSLEISGDLLALKGDHKAVFETYMNGIEAARKFAQRGDLEYELLRRAAGTSRQMGDTANGKDLISSALDLVEECGDKYECAICLRVLAQIEIDQGLRATSVDHLVDSVRILSGLSEWAPELGHSELALGRALAESAEETSRVHALDHMLIARRIYSNLGSDAAVHDIDEWICRALLSDRSDPSCLAATSENLRLAGRHRLDLSEFGIITSDERIVGDIARWGSTEVRVLIEGETGVGKELVARTLHAMSKTREGPFIPVDCGSLTESLATSELFGHTKGAFTGAIGDRAGLVEAANGGTLFLDEVGELSQALQVNLLRVLEEGMVRRVGENRWRPVYMRVMSATTKNLWQEVRAGNFRRDLYYRLKGVLVRIPALRERHTDIGLLVGHFMALYCGKHGKNINLAESAKRMLLEYSWPGNVRELKHVVEALVLSSGAGGLVDDSLVDIFIADAGPVMGLHGRVAWIERSEIERALAACGGNKSEAARMLRISRKTLYRKMASLE